MMTDQEARDDELEALIAEARREAGRWGPAPTATGMLINRLADALARKHPEPEWEYGNNRNGSGWDQGAMLICERWEASHRRRPGIQAGPWEQVDQ